MNPRRTSARPSRAATSLAALVALAALSVACSDSSGPAPAPPAGGSPALGSYELALTTAGGAEEVVRLDFVRNENKEVVAWTQTLGVVRRNTSVPSDGAVTLTSTDGEVTTTPTTTTLTVSLDASGAPTTVRGERKRANGPPESLTGTARKDATAPAWLPGTPVPPWEQAVARFSETVFQRDLAIPDAAKPAGTTVDLLPLAGTPWVAGVGVRTPSWEPLADPSGTVGVSDPSKNRAELPLVGLFAKVGPATATYDFERDEPAWRSAASTRGRAEDGCEKATCWIVRSGERLALRVPGGKKTLTLRLRLLRGAAPVEPAPLGIATVARGGATTAQAGVEVPFAKVDRPSSAEKAFATAAFDLPVPLNASAPESAVTVSLPATNTAPYFVALQGATSE
ncbi:MAG TPA: hypothetical protein PK141_12170 [Polyangiaceae bacterium]|nr:hypothetical protein [Polyangiaceae bacterium]